MHEFDFTKVCEEGVKLGQQRLEEASSFSSMFSSFCGTYGESLSSYTGATIDVRESSDPLELLRNGLRKGCALPRFTFPRAAIEGPEREEVSAVLMNDEGKEVKRYKVFDCVKDRLTGFPCSIEYNGRSVLCNTKQELLEALKQVPAERSAYVIKGLGLDKKSKKG